MFLAFLGMSSVNSLAQTAKPPSPNSLQILNEIKNAAIELCPAHEGSGYSAKIQGEADVSFTLTKLMKRLADLGVETKSKVKLEAYSGLLQKDLLQNNRDTSDCRTQIVTQLNVMLKSDKPPVQVVSNFKANSSVSPQDCFNGILYFENLDNPGRWSPETVWQCKIPTEKITSKNGVGISAEERLLIDQNKPKVDITWGETSVIWFGTNKPIFTIAIKNSGPTTVYISDIYIHRGDGKEKLVGLKFFPKTFVISPSEEILVPVDELGPLATEIDAMYDGSNFTYNASLNSGGTCRPGLQQSEYQSSQCDGVNMPFLVKLKFVDIFGDKYDFGKISFLGKQKWTHGDVIEKSD